MERFLGCMTIQAKVGFIITLVLVVILCIMLTLKTGINSMFRLEYGIHTLSKLVQFNFLTDFNDE